MKSTKLVYGVGLNDADYRVSIMQELPSVDGKRVRSILFRCPYYEVWHSMLDRCFSDKLKTKHPKYRDVICCDDWLTFSNFKYWMEQQDWEGKQLDKDIIVLGNKIYSPETCAFVNQSTNSFVTASDASRGEYPLGVNYHKKHDKFQARCNNAFKGSSDYLGLFATPEEAHEAWRKRKHELAQLVAATESDTRVIEALGKRYSAEEWYGLTPEKENNYVATY